jgi:hypothetical protein
VFGFPDIAFLLATLHNFRYTVYLVFLQPESYPVSRLDVCRPLYHRAVFLACDTLFFGTAI